VQIETLAFKNNNWEVDDLITDKNLVNLVTVFGETEEFVKCEHYDYLRARYPKAHIIGCSSSGNILGAQISESTMVATAVRFDSANVVLKSAIFEVGEEIKDVSQRIAGQFEAEGLRHLFLLADGLNVNGSDLTEGFNKITHVPKTGGLAGDGARFEQTWVMADGYAEQKMIAALGFYGDSLTIGSGCFGGWSEFGTFRKVTKSSANVLYELDGRPALDLYREYLGEYASELPLSHGCFMLTSHKAF